MTTLKKGFKTIFIRHATNSTATFSNVLGFRVTYLGLGRFVLINGVKSMPTACILLVMCVIFHSVLRVYRLWTKIERLCKYAKNTQKKTTLNVFINFYRGTITFNHHQS